MESNQKYPRSLKGRLYCKNWPWEISLGQINAHIEGLGIPKPVYIHPLRPKGWEKAGSMTSCFLHWDPDETSHSQLECWAQRLSSSYFAGRRLEASPAKDPPNQEFYEEASGSNDAVQGCTPKILECKWQRFVLFFEHAQNDLKLVGKGSLFSKRLSSFFDGSWI